MFIQSALYLPVDNFVAKQQCENFKSCNLKFLRLENTRYTVLRSCLH